MRFGTKYVLLIWAFSLLLLTAVVVAANLLVRDDAQRLRQEIAEHTREEFEYQMEKRLIAAVEPLRRRLFNLLYEHRVSDLEWVISNELRLWLPIQDFILADSRGRILTDGTRANPRFLKESDLPTAALEGGDYRLREDGDVWRLSFAVQHEGVVAGFARVTVDRREVDPLVAHYHGDINDAFGRFNRSLWIAVAVSLLMVVPVGLAIMLHTRRGLSRPLKELRDSAKRFAEGDFSSRVTLMGDDELAAFARSFNGMADELQRQDQELRREIEERRRTEERLRVAMWHAESANRAKSLFLANMSHELRTPLTSIIGFAKLLDDRFADDEEIRRDLRTIARNGETLLELINEVLELSRIENGHLSVKREALDLHALLKDLHASFQVQAQQRSLRLFGEWGQAPRRILGDRQKIRQVIANLLGNACKYAGAGEIRLRVQVSRNDPGALLIEVVDQGEGISARDRGKVFDAFFRGQQEGEKVRGAGLGLAISKQYATALGGDLELMESGDGRTVFRFTLPFARADKVAEDDALDRETADARLEFPGRSEPPRVIVVDHHPETRALAARILASGGVRVEECERGDPLLARLAGKGVDAVLCDVSLDDDAVFECIRRIRASPLAHPPKVFAVTADAFETQCRRFREAGFDDVLTKPYLPPSLLRLVARHLGGEWLSHPPAPAHHADLGALLRRCSAPWRQRMLEALKQLDRDAMSRLCTACESAEAAEGVNRYLHEYRYAELSAMLAKMESQAVMGER